MRILIVDDEFASRRLLNAILSPYGDCDLAEDGEAAFQAFKLAFEEKNPYDLICMDIMMPGTNGQQALKKIRELEESMGIRAKSEVKVIMTTALDDPQSLVEAYCRGGATSFIVKPIAHKKLLEKIRQLGLPLEEAWH